ncbi:uncharacterized protein [Aegilops tauschii subsp. strangulata]|uniref:uncharacterized protein n=1 Tax=Aegilops tauschii subsp. strangulata TaxID=200361 RepID=UPI003CC8A4EE
MKADKGGEDLRHVVLLLDEGGEEGPEERGLEEHTQYALAANGTPFLLLCGLAHDRGGDRRVGPRAPEVAQAQRETLLLAPCLLRRWGQRGGGVAAARKQEMQREEEEMTLGVKERRFGRQARGAGELCEAGGSGGVGIPGGGGGRAGEQGSSTAKLSRGALASMRPCQSGGVCRLEKTRSAGCVGSLGRGFLQKRHGDNFSRTEGVFRTDISVLAQTSAPWFSIDSLGTNSLFLGPNYPIMVKGDPAAVDTTLLSFMRSKCIYTSDISVFPYPGPDICRFSLDDQSCVALDIDNSWPFPEHLWFKANVSNAEDWLS